MKINQTTVSSENTIERGWMARWQALDTPIFLALWGVAGFLLLWLNTPWGIGVGYDSVFYLSAADNLLKGLGLGRVDGFGNFIPLTHFPPFYPISVAVFSFLTRLDIVLAARFLSALFFGVNIFLAGYLAYRYTHVLWAGMLCASLVLFSPVVQGVHLMAMSEPLYLALLFAAFLALDRYLSEQKIRLLLVSAGLVGLSFLTRYVGLSAVAAGGLALLVLNQRKVWYRLRDAAVFGGVSLIPMLAWYWRNWMLAGSTTNRTFLMHPLTRTQVIKALGTVSLWLLPARVPAVLRAVFVGGVGLILAGIALAWFIQLRRRPPALAGRPSPGRFALLLTGHAVIYLLMLGISLSFFDASTRLNDRILSPVYLTCLVVGMIMIWNGLPVERLPWLKVGITLAGFALLCMFAYRSFGVLAEMRQNGKGFTGRDWQDSALIAAVKQLPAGVLIYTNESLPVYFLTGRGVNSIPEKVDVVKGQKVADYADQVAAMRQQIIASHGALVVFKSSLTTAVYAPLGQLAEGLVLWQEKADGSIYVPR
jgi:hypothetical protein